MHIDGAVPLQILSISTTAMEDDTDHAVKVEDVSRRNGSEVFPGHHHAQETKDEGWVDGLDSGLWSHDAMWGTQEIRGARCSAHDGSPFSSDTATDSSPEGRNDAASHASYLSEFGDESTSSGTDMESAFPEASNDGLDRQVAAKVPARHPILVSHSLAEEHSTAAIRMNPGPANASMPALWKVKMVQRIFPSTRAQREEWIKAADYNLFRLTGDQVLIDLLTDSGTGAMSDEQWAAMITGDESYAGSSSFYNLERTVMELFGYQYVLPVHQGRAAENVFFSALVKDGHLVPGNSHFDTTKAHIEFRKAHAVDCTIDEAANTDSEYPFKGNVDLAKLRKVLEENPGKVPFIVMTVTCNTMGGQPVSMANLKAVKSMADEFGISVVLDAARFSENAYFIQQREEGYAKASIRDIVLEMHQLSDAMLMSSKKDAMVNIGGLFATSKNEWFQAVSVFSILFEGFTTYGGMAGRDMNALAVGLREAVEFGYLHSRISQVRRFGEQLIAAGIPVQRPIGGHAVYIDCSRFFPNVPKEEFSAQMLGVELFVEAGVRGVEIGTLLNGRDPVTGEERYAKKEFLRLAIPRRVYTNEHLDFVAAVLKRLYSERQRVTKGFKIKYESPVLRHFTVGLERAEPLAVGCSV